MAKSAGVITINVNAGTAQLVQDLDKAKAKVADFTSQGVRGFQQLGGHSVSSMQATSGALRDLQGNFTNNIRASERFIATTLGLGPVLQAAFPLVGGLAFGGMITEMGTKVHEFFKEMEAAPEKLLGAFRDLNAPIRTSNDALQVTNDKLQMEIDKLEGRHTNNLKLTLDEAREAADKLAESLDKDLKGLYKLLSEHELGGFKAFFTDQASTSDLKKQLGGLTGAGGATAEIDRITDLGRDALEKAATIEEKNAANTKTRIALEEAFNKLIRDRITELEKAKEASKIPGPLVARDAQGKPQAYAIQMGGAPGPDQSRRIETLEGEIRVIKSAARSVPLQFANQDLVAKKEALTSANDNAKMDRPFEDRIKAMKAQLEDLKAKLASVGQTDAFRAITEGHGNAIKIIAEVNKALEQYHRALSPAQKAEIDALAIQSKQTEIETAYRTKLDNTTRSIQDRITAAQALTAAIGRGYEATKSATVETQLATAMGREYNDAARSADQASLRSKLSAEFEARHRQEIGRAHV